MAYRAVGDRSFEARRYQITRAYQEPMPSGNVSWEVTPHFTASFRNIFFGGVNSEVRPKSLQAAQRLFGLPVFFQGLHEFENDLLFVGWQLAEFFEDHFLYRHARLSLPSALILAAYVAKVFEKAL